MIDAIQQYQIAAASCDPSEDGLFQARIAAVETANALGSSIDGDDAQPILVSHVLAMIDYTDSIIANRGTTALGHIWDGEECSRVLNLLYSADPLDPHDVAEAWDVYVECATTYFEQMVEATHHKDLRTVDRYGRRQKKVSRGFSNLY